ncbi:MAG: GIY-YIG nuclease family protein [Candidatus Sericytochromatia bacterium]|nr:GIY-YIG nuclease family protein [Candidatus Sericytochromatia bacterium]
MVDLTDTIKALPGRPGVYQFFDARDRLLYVGKSVNLKERVRSYFRADGGHSRRTSRLRDEADRIEVEECGSELEALILENRLIKQRQPLYNVMGRRHRHYPFIKITAEAFPRVLLSYELVADGGRYFGPFPGEYRAKEALEALRPQFQWRSCQPMPTRACFEHDIGRCRAPCLGAVDAAAYAAELESLAEFLAGSPGRVMAGLEEAMREAAGALAFERAAVLRDRMALLQPWVARQQAVQRAVTELDALVVLPAVEADATLWLVIRRGRLVHTERNVRRSKARSVATRLARAVSAPPPSLALRQEELDEVNLLAHWLHRHRHGGSTHPLDPARWAETLEDAWRSAEAVLAARC